MRLIDEMKEMVERLRLCYVATVTPDGKPDAKALLGELAA